MPFLMILIWLMDSSDSLSCNSFCKNLQTREALLSQILWKLKAPLKVRAILWTTILEKTNNLDNLRVWSPNRALSPSVCILCQQDGTHLFLRCRLANALWN